MAIIYLDECGHTGENLLDKQQPFFVLASHDFSEEQCAEMRYRLFPGVRSRSLKHSSLAKIDIQQGMVLSLIREIGQHQDRFVVSVTHKKYALVCKLVDIVIESYMHESGFDLYDRGANIALSNLIYQFMPLAGGVGYFNDMLELFQKMIRERTEGSFNDFFRFVFVRHESPQIEYLLDMMRLANRIMGGRMVMTLPRNALDVAISQAMVQMSTWRKRINESITLVHDTSTNMSRQKYLWDALTDPALPEVIVGYDRRQWSFPIGVTETIFERDDQCYGLQIADVIAGAFARAARWQYIDRDPKDVYGSLLMESVANIPVIPLLPGYEITPDDLGTTGDNALDPNDHITNILRNISDNREN